jgi:hypothetical protein
MDILSVHIYLVKVTSLSTTVNKCNTLTVNKCQARVGHVMHIYVN